MYVYIHTSAESTTDLDSRQNQVSLPSKAWSPWRRKLSLSLTFILDQEAKGQGCTYVHAQLCLTLCDPLGCSLPGFSVHGILQARVLEWIAISSSRGVFLIQGSNPCLLGLLHWQMDSLPLSHLGRPKGRFEEAHRGEFSICLHFLEFESR